MTSKINSVPDYVLAYNLSGTTPETEFAEINNDIKENETKEEELYILLILASFKWLSINDFWNELSRHISFPKTTKKIAIIASTKWLDKTSKLIDIITDMRIETFGLDDRKNALKWLRKVD